LVQRTAWIAAVLAALACSATVPFAPSREMPSASGTIAAELDDNGNAAVELAFEHLARPDALNPPRATYVIWAESYFGRQVLLGQIKVDEDRTAFWSGTVPFDRFRILLSAEDLAWPERPREPILLATELVTAK
jgi:hypothetical protein